jgi:hypothetical protein
MLELVVLRFCYKSMQKSSSEYAEITLLFVTYDNIIYLNKSEPPPKEIRKYAQIYGQNEQACLACILT